MADTLTPDVETREATNPLDAPDEEFLTDDSPTPSPEGVQASGTPETPESPEPETPETPGLTVDSAGRYHRADGTMASQDEIAAHKAAHPDTPTPEAPVAAPSPETAKPATEAPAPVTASAFKFRADGQTIPVEGSTVDDKGNVTWPAQYVPQLRQWLAAGVAAAPVYERLNQAQSRIKELESHRTEAEAKAEAQSDAMLTILNERDPNEALKKFSTLWQTWPEQVAEARVQYWKEQAERGIAKPGTQPQAPGAQSQPAANAGPTYPALETAQAEVSDVIEHAKLDHRFRGLTADDWKQFETRAARNPYAYIRPITAQEAAQLGWEPGSVAVDIATIDAELTEYMTSRQRQADAQKKAADLAASNARKTTPSVSAPPVAGGTKAPPASPKGFTSNEDVNDWFNNDSLD